MTLRRRLLVAGILPALLVVAYAVKVTLMLGHAKAGEDHFAAGEYGAAAGEFGANRSLDLFESWIADFDEGAARHAAGEHEKAVAAYTSALAEVPDEEECTVRINLALAHEAIGEAALEVPDPGAAAEAWRAGIDALAAGDCPTDAGGGARQTADAAAVDERLRQRLAQQPEQQPDDRPPQQDPQQPPERDREARGKERRLERRNESGAVERRRGQESDGDFGLDGPNW